MNILIFTDNDIDGAGSALLLKKLFTDHEVIIVDTTEWNILNEFKSRWNTLDHFDKIFVCDLALSEEQAEAINRENVVIIDHHASHVEHIAKYTKAKTIIKEYSSCTKLIADKFEAKLNLTDAQKELVRLIDQYDNWSFDFPKEIEPAKLNAIYYGYNRPKVNQFIEAFADGLREYTPHEKGSIKLFFKRFVEQLDSPKYVVHGKENKIVSTFVTTTVNEVANYIIDKYDADIAIMVNLDRKIVTFRKRKGCKAHLGELAEKLCDGGGSHNLAGGKLEDKFMTFSQKFTLIEA